MPVARIKVKDGKWSAGADDLFNQSEPALLTWLGDLDEDADDDEPENEDGSPAQAARPTSLLCLSCHAYTDTAPTMTCCTTPILRRLQRLLPSDDQGNLARCPRCAGGSGSFPTVLRTFVTGDDAPAAVLTETLMRHLPINAALPNGNRLPAHGRNLLVFSDSRQRAAFFAPYLSQTMAETAFLSPIKQALEKVEAEEGRAPTVREIAEQYTLDLNPIQMPVAVIRSRDEEAVEHYELVPTSRLSPAQRSSAKKEAQVSLFRHICSSTKQRGTLTGLGIAALTFAIDEDRWNEMKAAMPELFAQGDGFARELVEALLTVFTQKGAVDFPGSLQTRDVLRFGPHTREAFTFSRTQSGQVERRSVSRWNPYLAPAQSRTRAINSSRQLGILARGLKLDRLKDEAMLSRTLNALWDQFKEELLVESPWQGEYRLANDRVLLTTRTKFAACEVCGRLTTAHELGFCASPQCPGEPHLIEPQAEQRRTDRNHYRRRYSLSPLPLMVKEHTAQLTNRAAKEYQERFIRGEVNVLSSSTTFEMGVDVGGLKAVLLRNMPPKSSNYVQRAGRAGRRKDGVSVAVTYVRNAPHDQYLFQNPKMIIEGRMPVPFINITNTVLAQRHANSLLLGYFLRAMASSGMDAGMLDTATVEDFFLLGDGDEKLSLRFCQWLRQPNVRTGLLARLTAVLPAGIALTPEQALDEAEAALMTRDDSVLKERVEAPLQRLQEQLDDVRTQANDLARPVNQRSALGKSAISLEKLIRQFREQRLIDFLSSQSWLPGYAFPQNVVKLLVRHSEEGSRMRLERDREMGISEYAPGAEIVADGQLLRSGAISFNSREPDVRFYTRCPQCRKISRYLEAEKDNISLTCTRCGTEVIRPPKRYLKPDGFSTLVSDQVEEPGMYRKQPPRNSDVFLLEGARDEDFVRHASLAGVSYGIRRKGIMFRANSGYKFRGFKVCRRCGKWIEGAPGASHKTPWGSDCGGMKCDLHLAHELETDILQLRFSGCRPPAPLITDRPFWHSFQSSFLNGCNDALGIDFNDLGATFNGWTDSSWVGELVVYDRVPGGAGHIDRIVDHLDAVMQHALQRVRDCKGCTDVEASCYACLRTYSNQSQWDDLKRSPVIRWLSAVLGE